MITIINARLADSRLVSFDIESGHLRRLRTQGQLVTSSAARPLLAMADAAHDTGLFDAGGDLLLPAGIDIHVHSRDPGLTHKETWTTLAQGAYRGGVTLVCDMPNTLPPTLSKAAVVDKAQRAAASGIRFALLLGVGAANVHEVGELLTDPRLPLCALKVFYGKTTGELVYDDLVTLGKSLPRNLTKPIVFHSEDQCTIDCNHQRLAPRLAAQDNQAFAVHSEIRSSAAAHASTRAILAWAKDYGRPVHIAHVSTPLEVELVEEAKAQGVLASCEVAPHHLVFSTDDYARLGPLAKMNPPLRSPNEVAALRRLFGQGAIDVFATDHAPHLLSEKNTQVALSPSGVPGVELFYPLLLSLAEQTGLDLARAVAMGSGAPARLFGFAGLGQIDEGYAADFVLMQNAPWTVRGEEVVSKCGWTPYDGMVLPWLVAGTWSRGLRVYQSKAATADRPGGLLATNKLGQLPG